MQGAPVPNPYGAGGGQAPAPKPCGPSNPFGAGVAVPNPYAAGQPGVVAIQYAECPICFEPLCKDTVGVFLDAQGRRVSPHFYRFSAAQSWFKDNQSCPMTRAAVSSVAAVPRLREDPRSWFQLCDIDGDGKLSRKEVVEALKAQLDLDVEQLNKFASDDAAWRSWDTDGSGWITLDEITDPSRGLLKFITDRFGGPSGRGKAIPDIRQDRESWYRYWDQDGNGSLQREEVTRALVKTFGLGENVYKLQSVSDALNAVWPIFDPDGSGSVEKKEFLNPEEGLADTIIASMGR
eukprot:TRINITY_DN6438_c0_g1_i4.p1 TRINITY_DN6438_c0_g1~~TRINITY_DN6438_c0_g1_i4.p1  ORF type:complete len:310 (+),score=32.11 TRINITY_DN6438_c0_g1_i4:55-930(+)